MKKIYLLCILFVIILSQIAMAGQVKKDLSEKIKKISPDEKIPVIIKLHKKPSITDINILKSEGASLKHEYKIINAVAVKIPAKAAEKIAQRPFVDLVEPDYEVKLVLDTSTNQINARYVWQSNITGKDIDIAVLDTGIFKHSKLNVAKEIDFTGEGLNDLNGHGTHVAGIMASKDIKYKGVAPDANLFNAKVLNKDGIGYGSDIIKAMEWSLDNDAEIISMSLGAKVDPCDGTDAISQAVDNIISKGIVVITAAGNAGPGSSTITSPGCSKQSITIGAVDDNDNVASFSSRGPTTDGRIKPDIVAPGVEITSTWIDNSFKSLSGTSMAVPHVSGVAALMLEKDPGLDQSSVKEKLITNAKDIGQDHNLQGSGRVDALIAAKTTDSLQPTYDTITPLPSKPYIIINKFVPDKNVVSPGEVFTLTLEVENIGERKVDEVNSKVNLPDGFITDSLTKSIGSINAKTKFTTGWKVNGVKEGSYDIDVDVSSLNGGSASATASIGIFSLETRRKQNQTNETIVTPPPEDNIIKPKNESKYYQPPDDSKKESLPYGLFKKIGSSFDVFKRILERFNIITPEEKPTEKKSKRIVQPRKGVEALPRTYKEAPRQAQPVSEYYKKSIEALSEVYKKAPEQAKPAIEKAIEKQQRRHQEKDIEDRIFQIPERQIIVQGKSQARTDASVNQNNSNIEIKSSFEINATSNEFLPAQASAVAKSRAKLEK